MSLGLPTSVIRPVQIRPVPRRGHAALSAVVPMSGSAVLALGL